MQSFSPKVLSLLLSSGWSPGRCIDVHLQLKEISSVGFNVTEFTAELISQFQDLRVNSGQKRFRFDASPSRCRIEVNEVPYIKKLFSDRVCPFGYEEAGSLILLSSASNGIFGLNDEWLACWSFDSIEGMFEYLCFSGKGGNKIKIDSSQMPPSMRD